MRRFRAPLSGLDKFFAAQFSAGYTTSMPGFDLRQAQVKTRLDEVMAKVPMNGMGLPDEIAEAVVWMCSDKASFMTGASQVVDGGYYAA